MPNRARRHAEILRLIRKEAIPSQDRLRERLADLGFEVAQATLSRDLRSLGVVKVTDRQGRSRYDVPADVADPTPTLSGLLPTLCTAVDGVDSLLVIHTLPGGAQALAVAIDRQDWDEVVGTLAGDDTILVIARSRASREALGRRIGELARL